MTERGIIFQGWSVRRILEGGKTMTRRLAWHEPPFCGAGREGLTPDEEADVKRQGWRTEKRGDYTYLYKPTIWQKIRPGDVLWVREAVKRNDRHLWAYEADDTEVPWPQRSHLAGKVRSKLSPMFLPKESTRLRLKVTEARIEPLQAITEDDCFAEGALGKPALPWFTETWNAIHGSGAWRRNPDVVAITFEVVDAQSL